MTTKSAKPEPEKQPVQWIKVQQVSNGYVVDVRRGPGNSTRLVAGDKQAAADIVRDVLLGIR